MKPLLTLLLSLLCLTVGASPGQPYFVRPLPGQPRFTPLAVPGLAYWWVASDVNTNQFVTNWVDRIQGATMYQTVSARRPVPSTNAVVFSGGQILTNDVGFQQDYPVAYFVKMSFAHSASTWQMVINDMADVANGAQGMAVNTDDGIYQNMAAGSGAMTRPLTPNRSFSLLVIPTNPPGTYGLVYTNGASTGYQWNENGFSHINLRAFGGDTRSDPPVSYLTGAIQEIAVWTNSWTNLGNIFSPTMVSNLTWYATNPTYVEIYSQPQSVVCTTNAVTNFSITAVGDAPTYQWRTNGVGLSNSSLWSGVTASVLWVTNNGTVFSNLSVDCVVSNSYGSITSSAATLNADPLMTGLVLWWKMDEGTGTNVFDSSGSANTGGLYAGATWVSGAIGNAVHFDGSTQYILKSNAVNVPFGNTNRTVSCWVKAEQGGTGAVMAYGNTPAHEYFGCYADSNVGVFGWMFSDSNTSFSTTQTYSYGTWYLYTYTYDSASGIVTRFINGAFKDSGNVTSLSTANGNVWMGTQPNIAGFYKGAVDDLRVYNRALTTNEINQIYLLKP